MGAYDGAFQFDDPQVDTFTTFNQGVFAVNSSIERKCDRICCVRNFGKCY